MKINKTAKKCLSVFLSILMIMSALSLNMTYVSAFGETIGNNTQKHVVSNYQSVNTGYIPQYAGGFGVPLDGTNGNPDMVIPGLDKTDDMVPQGLTYYAKKNLVLVTSYVGSNKTHTNTTSVIYAMDFSTGDYVAKFNIYKADGTPFTAHAGGIAVSQNNIYICDSGSKLSYIPVSVLDNAAKGSDNDVTIAGTCNIGSAINNSGTSYLSLEDGILWTGNFYQSNNDSYNTPANSKFNSLIVGYDLGGYSNSADEWNALVSLSDSGTKTPSYVLACPDSVYDIQSVIVKDGKVYIGTSWGRNNESHIYAGTAPLNTKGDLALTLANGIEADAHLIGNIKAYNHLPMTEGMFWHTDSTGHNYIYNGFESAAYYYYGYESANMCKKPTDVIWKIDADALSDDAFSSSVSKSFEEADSGLSLEIVASTNNEPVTRIMRSSAGDIGTVYYAKESSNGTLTTNDSYYSHDYVLLKATNHSASAVTISKIEAPNSNFKIGKDADTDGTASSISNILLGAGETAYFKVNGKTSMGATTGSFAAQYTIDGIKTVGSVSAQNTAKAYLRVVNKVEGSENYYNNNSAVDILAMMGWNGKATFATPHIQSLVKYSSPADISRTIEKNTGNYYLNSYFENNKSVPANGASIDLSTIDSSGSSSAGFGGTTRTSKVYYNINAAKHSTLLSAKIIWKIGVWKDNNKQIFVHNQWTDGAGTVKTSDSKTQYPAFNINNDDFNSDVSGATLLTTAGTTDTYLTGINFANNLGKKVITNTIHVWNGDSRGATRVIGNIEVTLNAYNASALETLLHKCENTALVSGKYDPALWDAYQTALSDAMNKVGAYAQSQPVIDASYDALNNAYNALIASTPAEVYAIEHSLFAGRAAQGDADKTYTVYYMAKAGDSFTPEMITDADSKGFTLSLANKIDSRDEATSVTAAASDNGLTAIKYNYYAGEYTISFADENGTIEENSYFYASTPSLNSDEPTKASDETAHYVFSGWTPEIEVVTANQTYTAQFDSVEHTLGEYVNQNNASCTKNGTEKAVCSECGYEDERVIENSTLAHTETTINAKAPTCSEKGYTGDVICSVCKAEISKGTEIETVAHTPSEAVKENEVAPTCSKVGTYDEVVYCSVCDAEISRTQKTTDKTAHTEQVIPSVAPSCTKTGLTEGKKCSVCGEILVEQKTTDKLAHTETTVNAKAPTCSEKGYTGDVICSVCKAEISKGTEIETVAHTPSDAVKENEVVPTCSKVGTYDEVVYCAKCNAEISRTQKTADKLAHTETTINAKAPTCSEAGYTGDVICSVCKAEISKGTEIETVAHTPSDAVKENEVAPTCSKVGTYDEVVYCFVCDAEISRTQKTTDKTAHTEQIIPSVAPSCTKTGLTEGKKCSVCGEILVEQKTTDKLAHTETTVNAKAPTCSEAGYTGDVICSVCKAEISKGTEIETVAHTPSDAVKENEVAPTCSKVGTYDEVVYCAKCDAEISRTQKTTDKTAHTEQIIPSVAATCTKTGLTEGKKCSVCGEILVEQKTTDKVAHTETTVNAKAPTCSEKGYTGDVICSVCKAEISKGTEIETVAHTPSDAVKENEVAPTCSKVGTYDEVVYCAKCDAEISRTQKTTDKTAHTEQIIPSVAPSCTKTGLTEGKKCSVCGEILVEQKTTDKLAHTETTVNAKAPTCSEKGYTGDVICSVCKAEISKGTEIETVAHTPSEAVKENEVAPSCSKVGTYDEVVYCAKCDAEISRIQKTTDKTAHTEQVIPSVAATCTKTGLTEGKKCSVCGEILVEQAIVPVKTHSFVKTSTTEPTCTSEGYSVYKCSACGETKTADKVAKLPHTPKEISVAPTCTQNGSLKSVCSFCGAVISSKTVNATGHADKNNDGVCDVCGTTISTASGDRCGSCDWYDSTKDEKNSVLRFVYWFIHAVSHFIYHIEHR